MKQPALTLTLALLASGSMAAAATDPRAYAAGYFFLDLEGVKAGALRGMEGGAITADVVADPVPGGQAAEKHLGPIRFENLILQVGFAGMDASMYQWISRSWSQGDTRKDGAVTATDYRLDAKSRKEFTGASIVETTLPACDVSGKDPGFIKVALAPETIRPAKASGRLAGEIGRVERKLWSPANFRLTIDGLDCTRIARIESFTVKRPLARQEAGEYRDPLAEPGKVEFPDLKIILSAGIAQTWQDWFQDFVIAGKNGSNGEKRGTLEFLSPDRQEVLAAIGFEGLGIFRLEPVQDAADAAPRMAADLYCEKMVFLPGKSVR